MSRETPHRARFHYTYDEVLAARMYLWLTVLKKLGIVDDTLRSKVYFHSHRFEHHS